MHLDPRTKLLSIAAMAVAVALAPSTSCEVALMCVASAFGVVVGVRRGSAVALWSPRGSSPTWTASHCAPR